MRVTNSEKNGVKKANALSEPSETESSLHPRKPPTVSPSQTVSPSPISPRYSSTVVSVISIAIPSLLLYACVLCFIEIHKSTLLSPDSPLNKLDIIAILILFSTFITCAGVFILQCLVFDFKVKAGNILSPKIMLSLLFIRAFTFFLMSIPIIAFDRDPGSSDNTTYINSTLLKDVPEELPVIDMKGCQVLHPTSISKG